MGEKGEKGLIIRRTKTAKGRRKTRNKDNPRQEVRDSLKKRGDKHLLSEKEE